MGIFSNAQGQLTHKFFVTQYNLSLSSLVPSFRILTQVVAEESLTEKKVIMYYIRVKEGKNEKLKKEAKMRISILIFHLHSTLCLPEGVHKILNTGSNRSCEICDRNFHWRGRKMNK